MVDLVQEAEEAVLACVLISNGNCIDELAGLTGDDFYEPFRGDVFAAMTEMFAAQKPVEAFTLAERFADRADVIFKLTDTAVSVASAGYYADRVKQHSLRRRLAAAGAGLANIGPADDPVDVAERARKLLEDAIGDGGEGVRLVRDIIPALLSKMREDRVFVPSPWDSLNGLIGGFRPGAVYVVAARPGQGKTVVAGQIAATLAASGYVAFSSLEMTETELVARVVAERLLINVGRIRDARMQVHEWDKFNAGRGTLDELRIAIDDRSSVSATDVRQFVRQVSRKGDLAGAIVDYMQLMTSRERMDRHLQVSDFSRRLKLMAKDMQIPVIALSQLNRNSEATTLSKPKLSDLRESGAIEQDADVVLLLRREGEGENQQLIIDVAKNRHGNTGEVNLAWQGQFSRAVEWNSHGTAGFNNWGTPPHDSQTGEMR
jgi:replicative DNA helicase